MAIVRDSTWWSRNEGITYYADAKKFWGEKQPRPYRLDPRWGPPKGVKMQETALQKYDELQLQKTPEEKIKIAEDEIKFSSAIAKMLKDIVDQAHLAKKFGGIKEHLEYEAWQTLGKWFHYTAATEWTRPIKEGDNIIGWEARVNILDETGQIIATAENMCMRDEPNWKTKPNYAIRSMAQTRTAGKAFRSILSHIAVLAGYSPTPAEEMIDNFQDKKPKTTKKTAAKKETVALESGTPEPSNGSDAEMSEAQRKAIYKAGRAAKLYDDDIRTLVRWIAKREKLDSNSYKICNFLLGKNDNDEWKMDIEIQKYNEFRNQQEPDDIPI